MSTNLEEDVALFREHWGALTALSENLKWAIFPVGTTEIEFQAVKSLMGMFTHLDAFVFFKDEQDPNKIIIALEKILADYKEKASHKLAAAAQESGFELVTGA